jgi:hypothetical protein
LADIVKSRVKVSEFTAKDKTNMLDLFVNNERTLLKIYEALFPGRANPTRIGQLKNLSDEITIQSSLKPHQFVSIDKAYQRASDDKAVTRKISDFISTRNNYLAQLSLPQPKLQEINENSGRALQQNDPTQRRPVKLR